jgi:class 3 adenylate cyclase
VNTELFLQKCEELRQQTQTSPLIVDVLQNWFQQADPHKRYRANPFLIAHETGEDAPLIIRHLLYGVPIGLFDLYWDIHCPHCNMITSDEQHLEHISGPSACPMCEMDFEADFVRHVDVTFSLNKSIDDPQHIPLCTPPAVLEPRYGIGAKRDETVRGVETLPAGEYRYFCPLTFAKGILTVSGEPTEEVQELSVTQVADGKFNPPTLTARPGPIAITLSNAAYPFSGLFVTKNKLPQLDPQELPPRLSGLHMIHYPEFRLLFGDEVLSQRERLQIAAVTTLFTDITGSTQMYERLGDALAYNIVRDHFDILFQSIEDQGGRIVKTIGDAVMASFITNQQAIKSIVEFLDGIERYNKSREDNEYVYLKIGVHRGAAILVNLNGSLDYFGSTINKAARIQGLSGSCQITFSEEIYHDEASLSIFEEAGMHHFTRHTVNLKGIEGEQTVYKVSCKEFDTRQNQREPFLVTLRDLFKLK